MSEIDKYLDRVCHTLGGSRSLRRHVREELREHIEDAVAAHVAAGLSGEDATRKALEELGKPEAVGEGLEEVHGHSLMALVVDRAMAWKESTMKTGWKWSFVGAAALVCVIVAQVLLLYAQLVFIMPRSVYAYEELGIEAPGYLLTTLRVCRFVFDEPVAWTLIALFAACWGVFEWRSASDNKAVIRLAAGAVLAFVTSVALWAVTFSTVVPLAQTAGLLFTQDPRQFAAAALSDAERAMAGTSSAVRAADWPSARRIAGDLRDAAERLQSRRTAAALVAMKTPADVEKVSRLLDDLAQAADDMHDGIDLSFQPEYQIPRANDRLRELERAWQSFCREVPCESTDTAAQRAP